MKRVLNLLFILFFVQTIFAQYQEFSYNDFMKISKLDEMISLDQNFDYNLLQTAVFQYTNKHRIEERKPMLVYNNELENSANLHSNQMKKYNFFDHVNRREKLLRELDDRANYVGYNNYEELAENLYYGFIDLTKPPTYRTLAKTIVQALIDSKAHNLNLINKNLKEMGTSIVFKNESEYKFLYYYVTQSFGTQY